MLQNFFVSGWGGDRGVPTYSYIGKQGKRSTLCLWIRGYFWCRCIRWYWEHLTLTTADKGKQFGHFKQAGLTVPSEHFGNNFLKLFCVIIGKGRLRYCFSEFPLVIQERDWTLQYNFIESLTVIFMNSEFMKTKSVSVMTTKQHHLGTLSYWS